MERLPCIHLCPHTKLGVNNCLLFDMLKIMRINLLRYLYGILIGSQLPLWAFPWVMVVPCIIFLPLSFFINDTPLWLVKQVN